MIEDKEVVCVLTRARLTVRRGAGTSASHSFTSVSLENSYEHIECPLRRAAYENAENKTYD